MERIPVVLKDASAELDYGFDWAERGWLEDGETIAVSTWSIPAGLTQITSGVTGGTKAVVWLAGGVVNQDYTITNQITTSAGRTDQRSITLRIRER